MDKKSFISIIKYHSRSTVAEALEILSLKQQYPYSQILHALSAKVSKDHGFSTQQQELQLAAIYSSDRAVLKEVMNADLQDAVQQHVTPDTKAVEEEIPLVKTPAKSIIPKILSTNVAEEIMNDLSQLNKSRHDFEKMFADFTVKTETEEVGAAEDSTHSDEEKDHDQEKSSIKSKKARIIEIAKALEAGKPVENVAPKRKKKDNPEALIEEIASTKKEIDPETEAQKAQIQIIDQFIKAQPSIVNSKDKPLPPPSEDLSVIKSGEFGDNIVSETLVDILVKQGKKDKAIEVLKKLIWKFPQKKAYFAAQIDELKK